MHTETLTIKVLVHQADKATIAVAVIEDGESTYTYEGSAKLHRDDQPDSTIGFGYAVARALQKLVDDLTTGADNLVADAEDNKFLQRIISKIQTHEITTADDLVAEIQKWA